MPPDDGGDGLRVDVCVRHARLVREVFVCIRPGLGPTVPAQARRIMDTAADALRQHHAWILQERIFAHASAMHDLANARRRSYGDLADAVEPTWLHVPSCDTGAISGVQIHAVAGCGRPDVLAAAGRPCGRLLRAGSLLHLAGCNLQGDSGDSPAGQTRAMLAAAEDLLAQAGGTLADVSRTWMWLGDILAWYSDFNRVRSDLFAARGLLRPDATGALPASTGIGVSPAGGRDCAMDFAAVLGGQIRFLLGAGRQGPASRYGSAFSRAAITDSPAGKTVYISGTAAIDADGRTTHVGDVQGQIADTIENVREALCDAGACEKDVIQAVVYCKNREVERMFRQRWDDLPMPWVLVIADVCRDNLLFEIEATAMPAAGQMTV